MSQEYCMSNIKVQCIWNTSLWEENRLKFTKFYPLLGPNRCQPLDFHKLESPFPKDTSYHIWLKSVQWFLRRSCLKEKGELIMFIVKWFWDIHSGLFLGSHRVRYSYPFPIKNNPLFSQFQALFPQKMLVWNFFIRIFFIKKPKKNIKSTIKVKYDTKWLNKELN